MKKERSLSGIQARDFIISQIQQKDPGHQCNHIKLSISLACDLLKLTPGEIGKFADAMLEEGLGALVKNKLYGYSVEIAPDLKGHVAEFGSL
jgi:hypothetical protein